MPWGQHIEYRRDPDRLQAADERTSCMGNMNLDHRPLLWFPSCFTSSYPQKKQAVQTISPMRSNSLFPT